MCQVIPRTQLDGGDTLGRYQVPGERPLLIIKVDYFCPVICGSFRSAPPHSTHRRLLTWTIEIQIYKGGAISNSYFFGLI